MLRRTFASLVTVSLLSCQRVEAPETTRETAPTARPSAERAAVAPPPVAPHAVRAAPERLVAIGDIHGDLDHLRRALALAGAIDAHDHWVGGQLVVVQTGDEIDRGDDDRAILDLVDALKTQATAAGGELVALLGNHEIMNASLDFRYVTPGGFAAFAGLADHATSPALERVSAPARGRASAFLPGGVYATRLSHRPVVATVGDSVFVHGGVLPKHATYGLDRVNDEVDAWLAGKRPEPPALVTAEDGLVWTRAYSGEGSEPDCATLAKALTLLHAKRLVVGHTVQHAGVNSACGGAVWRIDVGLSHYYGGPIEALEIKGDRVSVLRESAGQPR